MYNNEEIQNRLNKILIDLSVSQINKSEDYIIQLNHYPVKDDNFPNLIFINLLSDWYIKELGTWESLNSLFPLDTSNLSIPYDPIKAFYLLYVTENRKITNVKFSEDSILEIIFDNDFTIVLPNNNEYNEYAWIISGKNLSISYNADENNCYYEEAY